MISSLPIPDYVEIEGMDKYTTMKNRHHELEMRAKALWDKCRELNNEVLLLANKPLDELSAINAQDNMLLTEIESLLTKIKIAIPNRENVFLQNFVELSETIEPA